MSGDLQDLGYPSNFASETAPQRAQKYIRPECNSIVENGVVIFQGCRDTPKWGAGDCEHGAYTSNVEIRKTVPKLSDPDENGRRKVLGQETEVWHEERFNISQVAFSARINTARGPEYYKGLGWLDPAEVGLAPFCEYRDCYSQKIKFNTAHGRYCSELHAKMIAADENEDHLEIRDEKKRARQLAQIAV